MTIWKRIGIGLVAAALSLVGIASASAQSNALNTGVPIIPTLQTSAYAAGNSLGGLQTIPVFRTTAIPSGIFDSFMITSKAGSTVAVTVYIFDKSPTGSTCTDKVALSLAAADITKLAMAPFVLTPAVIGNGTTATIAQLAQVVSIKNQDGPPATRNLYVCIVANASITPASTSDLVAKLSGALD